MRGRALAGLAALVLAGAAQAQHVQPAAAVHAAAAVLNPDLAGLHRRPDGGLLAWGSDATIWQRDPAGPAWQPAVTPHSARIRALATGHERLVAVGDRGLLLQSDLQGRRWQAHAASAGAALGSVDCRGTLCVAVGDEGLVLRDAEGTAAWRRVQGPAGPLSTVRAAAGSHWWIGGADGRLWQSADDGLQWRARVPARGAAVDTLAADGEGVLVATSDGALAAVPAHAGSPRHLHRSARGTFLRLQALPAPGAWVATGTLGSCAWRPAAAAAWRSCALGPRRIVRALASAPSQAVWVAVGEAGLLMRSTDQGRRWQAAAVAVAGLDEPRDLEDVAWDAAQPGFVAVGAGGLVLRSDAAGQGWAVEHSAPRHYVHDVAQTRDGSLIASLSYRTLARSHDGGRHWVGRRFDGLHEPAFLFAVHADASGALVVAGGQGSVMVAPDGRHWRHASRGHGADHLGLLPHPTQPQVLMYGTGGAVLRVDSAAATWHSVALPAADPVYGGLYATPEQPLLLGGGGLLLHGSDGGRAWQLHRLGDAALHVGARTPDGSALLVAGDRGALYRAALTAQGEIGPWQRMPAPLADWRVLQADAAGQALWLAGSGGQFARSTDGGLSWQGVAMPVTAALRRPVHDARRQRWWMPGREGTLLRSDDDGRSWQRVYTHTDEHLKGVWVDAAKGALLLYGARLVRLEPGDGP